MRNRARGFAAASAAVAGAVVLAAGPWGIGEPAEASAPVDPPVFTNPTTFTHPFFPFAVGGVKVHLGKEDGERITVVELYLAATRDFTVGGETVTCRALQETEFEGGELVEISVNWFAQADDGTVYYFGETVDDYEDGVVTDHGGSWLVGGPVGNDPPQTMTVTEPAVFLPGNPEIGDEFKPEDLPDGSVEIGTVHRLDQKFKTPAGKFTGCLEIRETHLPDEEFETKWYAPGVGVVAAKAKGENLKLESSTFRQE